MDTDFAQVEARFESIKNKITSGVRGSTAILRTQYESGELINAALRDPEELKKLLSELDGRMDANMRDQCIGFIEEYIQNPPGSMSGPFWNGKERKLQKLQIEIKKLKLVTTGSTVPVSNIQSVTTAPVKPAETVATPISSSVRPEFNHGTM